MIEPVISYLLGNCSDSTETKYLALQLRFNFNWVTDKPLRAYLTDNCSQYFTFDFAGVTESLTHSLTSIWPIYEPPLPQVKYLDINMVNNRAHSNIVYF